MAKNTSPRKELHSLVSEVLDYIADQGSSGKLFELPSFDLYPREYLDFSDDCLRQYAIEEEPRRKVRLAIDCLGHLKRAMDCQLAIFFTIFGLNKLPKRRRGSVSSKLEFLARTGVFEGRSLRRLNSIRNSLEHDFSAPRVADLEAFFDLTTAFVAVMESAVLSVKSANLEIGVEPNSTIENGFLIMDFDPLSLRFEVSVVEMGLGKRTSLECNYGQFDDFVYFFRVWYFLNRIDVYPDRTHLRQLLTIEASEKGVS